MDLIERQEAIDAVDFGITFAKVIDKSTGDVKELFQEGNRSLTEAIERIKNLPSAQPEEKMKDLINEQPEQDIEHCATCIHAADSEDYCSYAKKREVADGNTD